jgi:hypothetical protein
VNVFADEFVYAVGGLVVDEVVTEGACDFLQRKFASLDFLLVLLALIGLSDFYFQKVTRTRHRC